MLKQRVVTALLLLLVLILALWPAQPWGFPVFVCLFVAAAVWEWLRLLSVAPPGRSRMAAVLGIVLGVLVAHTPWLEPVYTIVFSALLLVSVLTWLVLAAMLLVRHRFPSINALRLPYLVIALALPFACGLALVSAYHVGLVFTVSIMALVWVADIAAYFSGKAFGRHKLAPAISPGKTWEGVAGGLLAVLLLSWLTTQTSLLAETFEARLWRGLPLLGAVGVLVALVGFSICGDLFESHLKRHARVKDSSGLLPGHGGVLDRIDALLPVAPLAVLIMQQLGAS